MRYIRLIVLLLLGNLLTLTAAQSTPDPTAWEIIIRYMDTTTNALHLATINRTGITDMRNITGAGLAALYRLSPDNRYGLTHMPVPNASAYGTEFNLRDLALVDFEAGGTPMPLASEPDIYIYRPGAFSPDSRYLALPYTEAECTCEADMCCSILPSGILIIDVTTRQEIRRIDVNRDAYITGWTDEGIVFYYPYLPRPGADMPPYSSASLSVANPETGTITPATHPLNFVLNFNDVHGDRLTTGEYVMAAPQYDEFDASGRRLFNEIRYFTADDDTTTATRIHTEAGAYFENVHWVQDGNAIFFQDADYPDFMYVLERSGTLIPIEGEYTFVAGTPEGFIIRTQGNTIGLHHIYKQGDIWASTELGQITSDSITILRRPPLGATATGTFPEVPEAQYRG